MAQIVVERSPIASFLDELPGLILQYKQMQYAQEERSLEREERKALRGQEILLKEYYDKKDEVSQTEKMFDKYDNLGPADISQGGADIINIVDEQNNIDMSAITSNLDALSTYQSQLESSLGQLKGQAQTLKEMQMDFAGANKVLEPHEYEAFQSHALQALEEGGLGWETTAGADVEYYKTDPTARYVQALKVTEKMQSDEDTGAKGNYAILQSMYALGEGEDADDLVDRLTYEDASGKEIEPSEEVITAIQRMAMQPSYDDFITNLNAYPAEAGGDLIRAELAANPNTAMIFNNLQQNVKAIDALDLELSGINEPIEATNLDHFVSNISGVTNKEALFGLYDQATADLDPSQHAPFFSALEAQLGGEDLGAAYMEHKGFASGAPAGTEEALDLLSDKEKEAQGLEVRRDLLSRSGFSGTELYENIADSLTALNLEIRTEKDYRQYRERLDKKLLEGKLTEEELIDLSSLINVSTEDLKGIIEEKRQQAAILRQPVRRPAYEIGIME